MYLENYGKSIETLGYYEASIVILTSYFGIIFSSMSIDFFPKLTNIHRDNKKIKTLVNEQIEVALLLVTPLIILLYCFSKLALKILYSSSFTQVEDVFKFGLLAIILKALIWPLGYIILAKDDKRQYFIQELLGDFFNIILSITLYNYLGLTGIGLAMLINYTTSLGYIYNYIRKNYDFSFNKETIIISVISITLGIIACLITCSFEGIVQKTILGILLLISSIYSFKKINSKTDLINSIKQKLNL